MTQETLNLLIGALIGIVSSLLTLIIGNYFQDRREIRKRIWELEDRETNRYLEAKDKRIQEAQAYLDTYEKAAKLLMTVEHNMITNRPAEKNWADLDEVEKLTKFTAKRLVSMDLLNDEELKVLDKQLIAIFNSEIEFAADLQERFSKGDTIDVKVLLRNFYSEIALVISEMQKRIEILTQTIK